MTDELRQLLETVETVEITTQGRLSGQPRRVEIWMYAIDGHYIITGTPGPRDWYANLLANPSMTLHLPGNVDLDTTAHPVADQQFRRTVFTAEKTWWYRSQTSVENLIAESPMVEMVF